MMGSRFTGWILLLLSAVEGIEFYYTVDRTLENCFEDHLPEQALMTGEVYFEHGAGISMKITSPIGKPTLNKVREVGEL